MTQPTRRELANAKTYALLNVSEEDMRQAAFYARHLLKKGWHSEEWERRGTVYYQQAAFTTALVMAYTRPFTQTRGGSSLNGKTMAGFTEEQKQLHKRMKLLRINIFAHTDISTRRVRPMSLEGYPTAIEAVPPMRLLQWEVQHLQTMIALVQRAVAEQKRKLLPVVSTGDFGRPVQPRLPQPKKS